MPQDRSHLIQLENLEAENKRRAPKLDAEEQGAMDSLLAAYRQIQGWGLRANGGELTAAVHVIQGFIIQHMLQRVSPEHWSAWFEGIEQSPPIAPTPAPATPPAHNDSSGES